MGPRKDFSHFGCTALNGPQFARHHFQQTPRRFNKCHQLALSDADKNVAASTTAPQDSRTLEPALLTGATTAECFLHFATKNHCRTGDFFDLSPCFPATLLVRVFCLCFFVIFCQDSLRKLFLRPPKLPMKLVAGLAACDYCLGIAGC